MVNKERGREIHMFERAFLRIHIGFLMLAVVAISSACSVETRDREGSLPEGVEPGIVKAEADIREIIDVAREGRPTPHHVELLYSPGDHGYEVLISFGLHEHASPNSMRAQAGMDIYKVVSALYSSQYRTQVQNISVYGKAKDVTLKVKITKATMERIDSDKMYLHYTSKLFDTIDEVYWIYGSSQK
jgi:hypothetical protein